MNTTNRPDILSRVLSPEPVAPKLTVRVMYEIRASYDAGFERARTRLYSPRLARKLAARARRLGVDVVAVRFGLVNETAEMHAAADRIRVRSAKSGRV